MVKVDGCEGCSGEGQYETFSDDNLLVNAGTSTGEYFGFGTFLLGRKVTTSICISNDYCVPSTDFVGVTLQ